MRHIREENRTHRKTRRMASSAPSGKTWRRLTARRRRPSGDKQCNNTKDELLHLEESRSGEVVGTAYRAGPRLEGERAAAGRWMDKPIRRDMSRVDNGDHA